MLSFVERCVFFSTVNSIRLFHGVTIIIITYQSALCTICKKPWLWKQKLNSFCFFGLNNSCIYFKFLFQNFVERTSLIEHNIPCIASKMFLSSIFICQKLHSCPAANKGEKAHLAKDEVQKQKQQNKQFIVNTENKWSG